MLSIICQTTLAQYELLNIQHPSLTFWRFMVGVLFDKIYFMTTYNSNFFIHKNIIVGKLLTAALDIFSTTTVVKTNHLFV